jgi:predicted deacylase
VASGHWRHNLNGVDLNRDWGPFSQPETRAMRDAVLRYQSDETPRLAFFLDFHSTFHDVFYLEPADEGLWPAGFARRWLAAVSARMPDYTFRTEANPPTKPYSKTWVRKTLEVPAVIYETGDHTDRTLVRQVATVAAEEMMRLLLQEVGR